MNQSQAWYHRLDGLIMLKGTEMRKELDEFEQITILKAKSGECEGDCEHHIGGCVCVRVIDSKSDTDWGFFSYCETALLDDTSRGFIFQYSEA